MVLPRQTWEIPFDTLRDDQTVEFAGIFPTWIAIGNGRRHRNDARRISTLAVGTGWVRMMNGASFVESAMILDEISVNRHGFLATLKSRNSTMKPWDLWSVSPNSLLVGRNYPIPSARFPLNYLSRWTRVNAVAQQYDSHTMVTFLPVPKWAKLSRTIWSLSIK